MSSINSSWSLRVCFGFSMFCFMLGASSSLAATIYAPNPALSFTDASVVNLLERWNSNGTYAVTYTDGEGNEISTIDYAAAGNGWRVNKPAPAGAKLAKVRYTFDTPKTISRVTSSWRAGDHSPDNYTWRDQNGDFVINPIGGGRFGSGTLVDTFAPRTSNYVEFEAVLNNSTGDTNDPDFYHVMENLGLAVFSAPGESLAKDGSYNIMYEEVGLFSRTGGDAAWTDFVHGSNGVKPVGANGSVLYELSKPYELRGALLSQYDTGAGGRFLANALLEVSMDGLAWTTVYSDADWRFRGEVAPRDLGYMVFNAPYNTAFPQAQFVRLSWSGNNNPVEITEFQLYGVELQEVLPAPEPGTGLLLCVALLGGHALRRKQNRREIK